MTKDPIAIKADSLIEEVSEIFSVHQISSVPVVDDNRTPLGALSELGLVKILIRNRGRKGSYIREFNDVLTPLLSVPDSANLEELVRVVLKNQCHRAYITSESNGSLVGVVSPKDIISIFAGESPLEGPQDWQHKYDKLIHKLHDVEKQLEIQRKMITDSPILMHSVDRAGVILMANRVLHMALGYNYGELIGKTIYDLYPHNVHPIVTGGLNQVLDVGFHDVVETSMVCKNNTLLNVELISSSYVDPMGVRTATITVGRLSDKDKLKDFLNTIVASWESLPG